MRRKGLQNSTLSDVSNAAHDTNRAATNRPGHTTNNDPTLVFVYLITCSARRHVIVLLPSACESVARDSHVHDTFQMCLTDVTEQTKRNVGDGTLRCLIDAELQNVR